MGRDYPLLFSAAGVANLRVIADGGEIIAHAGLCVRRAHLGSVTVTVGALGAVFTRADHRGRGLGAAVVADALARAREASVALALVSGEGPLYRRLGFNPVPAATVWSRPAHLQPANAPPSIVSEITGVRTVDLRPAVAADVPLLARLYDAEPVRFVRSTADWQAILQASVIFAWPAQLWIVQAAGHPVGYLVVARREHRRILELAGDRRALLAAAPLVGDEIVAPWYETELAPSARAAGWESRDFPLAMGSQWLEAPPRPRPIPWYGLNYV